MDTSAISASGINTNSTYQTTGTAGTQSTHKHHRHAKGAGNGNQQQPPDVNTFISQLQSKLGLNDNQVISLTNLLQKDFSSLTAANGANGANASNNTTTPNGTTTTNATTNATTTSSTNNSSQAQSRKSIFTQINSDIMSVLSPQQQQAFSVLFKSQNDGDNS